MFGCLTETRVKQENHYKIMRYALPGWKSITNYDYNRLGKIWFCWKDEVVVMLLHKSAQIITCAVQNPVNGEQFICSAIYASNFMAERRLLWEDIRATRAAYEHLSLPWILLGDYNVTLSSSEHSRSQDYMVDQSGMRHFQDLVYDCHVLDLPYVGSLYTWWNKRGLDPIGKKVDRTLINGDWLRFFPHSFAKFEAGGVFDHARCIVSLTERQTKVRKPFKFFNFLIDNADFFASHHS